MQLDQKVFILVLALLFLAAVFDLRRHIIPNGLILALLFLTIAEQILCRGTTDLGNRIFGFVIPFFCLIPLYLLRMIGAGDVKLCAVIGAWFGIGEGLQVLFLTLILGAGYGMVKMLVMGTVRRRLQVLTDYIRTCFLSGKALPYPEEKGKEYERYLPMAVPAFCAVLLRGGGIL